MAYTDAGYESSDRLMTYEPLASRQVGEDRDRGGTRADAVRARILQPARPSPLASVTNALPVSINALTRFGSASPKCGR